MITEAVSQRTIFEAIGGQAAVDRLVEAFYHQMDTLPEVRGLRAMHAPDLTETKRVLKLYLAQWMGGPADYSAERGHPRLRARHLGFTVGVAERDAWLLCMSRALMTTVPDADLRGAILQALTPLADWMRNQPGQ
ncbi:MULTISPECIES: group II truncated hemoglobin [Nitrospirillum]|uniref:Hemoglobin n=1 Tax=Nitrospirillum amazonense TaxID=28077 RepID=A0A560GA40_9PROT|nr:group II truncated hemoglobin [Nitrospirillum amazonense]MEC4591721.1 group II truncated hemoglobin [Nitrospirillum amazonense]TWB30570.1 hemoglobin [Nitrospirillum amazonense]